MTSFMCGYTLREMKQNAEIRQLFELEPVNLVTKKGKKGRLTTEMDMLSIKMMLIWSSTL